MTSRYIRAIPGDRMSWFQGAGSGCGECGRRFWPSLTQGRKRTVPIHDSSGGICDGSITPTTDFEELGRGNEIQGGGE